MREETWWRNKEPTLGLGLELELDCELLALVLVVLPVPVPVLLLVAPAPPLQLPPSPPLSGIPYVAARLTIIRLDPAHKSLKSWLNVFWFLAQNPTME